MFYIPFKACSPRTVATSRPNLACWAFHCSNLIWRRKIILIIYTSTYYVLYTNTLTLMYCTFVHHSVFLAIFKRVKNREGLMPLPPTFHQLKNMECLSNEFGNECLSICNMYSLWIRKKSTQNTNVIILIDRYVPLRQHLHGRVQYHVKHFDTLFPA